eukprot:Rmarinus@m.24802
MSHSGTTVSQMASAQAIANTVSEQHAVTTTNASGSTKAIDKPLWLDAWDDPIAGVKTLSSCVRVADLRGDGDDHLLIADFERKLRVYKGTRLVVEHALLDLPSALCAWYADNNIPREPLVAVASGPHVFIYRNLRPYYKFTLPPLEADAREKAVWEELRLAKIDTAAAKERLEQARQDNIRLTSRSIDFLAIEDEATRNAFVEEYKNNPIVMHTVITCMETLKKDLEDDTGIASLVLGTETGHVMVLECNGTTVRKMVKLKAIPAFIACSGLQDVEYRICVACRDGNVYTIKNGELTGNVIELESQPCGLVRIGKSIIVGCMSHVIHSFHLKGRKNYSIYLPSAITNMEVFTSKTARSTRALIVSLANGEIRIYNEKHLVSQVQVNDVCTAMRFGRYSREDYALILAFRTGALSVKMFPRTVNLESTSAATGPPPEQDIPLSIPKKTKLYVEQTQRELSEAVDMHRIFQRDLCKLRLATARAYVKVLTDGQGPLSYTAGSSLRLHAQVQGLGPRFKIKIGLQNTGKKPIFNVPVLVVFNESMYEVPNPFFKVPVLVPAVQYKQEVCLSCVDSQTGGGGVVKVFVLASNSCIPVICAVVNMPWTDPNDIES